MYVKMYALVMLIVLFGFGGPLIAAKKATPVSEIDAGGKYLRIVKAYADTMLRDGRDTYGRAHSPLFATTLDRKTVKMFDGFRIGLTTGTTGGFETPTGTSAGPIRTTI
ncbi:MAG: hypothetical protein ACYSUC_12970 [Planctomycetota bacterium]|jgi:hypothetical protein